MKVSSISTSVLLIIFLFYILTWLNLGGVNVITLPWISLMTVALVIAMIFSLYGRYIIPIILRKLGIKIYIGDGWIDDKYFIVTNYDSETGIKYSGLSVIKLIPTTPSVDLREEDKKLLLRNIESLILALPSDVEYGIMKVMDPSIKKLLKKIETEIGKYYARKAGSKNPGVTSKYDRKIADLERERERILKSNPVSGIIYVKVFAKGRTAEEVKEKLKKLIEQVSSSAHTIQCTYKVLNSLDLYDFIEAQLVSRSVRYVTK
ncbi:MAG: hypothetical protein QXK24_00675 [Ignisphaera sp.]|uniref:Uncharacterized protein n=1 Tax=Ignisphaera aggregans TaxID=334771 RepID=A0A7C4H1W7_9CREN